LVLLDRGIVVADGTPEQVLDPVRLSSVYGVTMERIEREGKTPLLAPVVGPLT
jgi:ABC-type cobalamin/Fe3+-siderophores transport system ATPase subunit